MVISSQKEEKKSEREKSHFKENRTVYLYKWHYLGKNQCG